LFKTLLNEKIYCGDSAWTKTKSQFQNPKSQIFISPGGVSGALPGLRRMNFLPLVPKLSAEKYRQIISRIYPGGSFGNALAQEAPLHFTAG